MFTQFDMPIDLDTVADRVANHDGVIWTEVVSLRREDAERLHFNNAEAWKNLVRRNMNEIAKAHRIKVEDLEWYGAFHNTTHHPHIHLIIFSKGQEGFLSEKGIKELRRAFGQDIFRDEQYKLATIETGYRNQLKEQLADQLQKIQKRQSIPNSDYYLLLLRKIRDEVQQQKGKKLYGYLPRKTKKLVDFALHEFAKDGDLSEIYASCSQMCFSDSRRSEEADVVCLLEPGHIRQSEHLLLCHTSLKSEIKFFQCLLKRQICFLPAKKILLFYPHLQLLFQIKLDSTAGSNIIFVKEYPVQINFSQSH